MLESTAKLLRTAQTLLIAAGLRQAVGGRFLSLSLRNTNAIGQDRRILFSPMLKVGWV